MSKSLYDILGVPPDADNLDIKKAYRTKAQRLHPDKETGDEAAFKELLAAYEVLMDEARRKFYDETGEVSEENESAFIQEAIVIFLHLIDSVEDVECTDMIAASTNIVNGAIRKTEQTLAALRERIEDRKKVFSRLSCTSKENILGQGVQDSIRACEQEIVKVEKLKAEGERIKSFLGGYAYKADERKPVFSMYGSATSGPFLFMGGRG